MSTTTVPFLDLPAQHAPLKSQLLDVASRALDKAAFIGGPEVSGFEAEFAAYCGAEHCVGVGSGTDALALALRAMGVGPGDTVVTVPNTFIATTEAISLAGASFAFVDVDPGTCLLDPGKLEDYCKRSPAPKAVIPVHLYGQCADMAAIGQLAEKYGFDVLEDAAQAHGASQHGRKAGTLGRAAAFSFYPGKNLGACGEGGAVTTSDPAVADAVRRLRDHGQAKKYHHSLEGTNARLDAMQAGFLRVKLPSLEGWNQRRRAVAEAFDRAFGAIPGVRPVTMAQGNVSSRHLYVLHVPDREGLQAHLSRLGIGTGLHYPVPLHLQECYAGRGCKPGDFPAAEASAASLISLPMFPEMTDAQMHAVIDAVRGFYGTRP
ncbi:DegT/DnrJ/EryC1/StrS family aminotransferase [Fundidesulfovibrio agrisoli]|uniref:DegT/DnrJ/EryC1/StrS family aminotransferase n=1 Tax=Fundidesulfovibrio agrisoli TaxID=2922717 RepID=UPI001FAC3E38|nr:DegT/DnrJ/EryC1/StrS family aminotransferase [Fundidesulfovibrio agrisoli]